MNSIVKLAKNPIMKTGKEKNIYKKNNEIRKRRECSKEKRVYINYEFLIRINVIIFNKCLEISESIDIII
ncbi:MAG: hypothetical protein JW904_12105 [Spirochaetales bacterium]|nr:hypothetical protein [Spirochaetales bacterium]